MKIPVENGILTGNQLSSIIAKGVFTLFGIFFIPTSIILPIILIIDGVDILEALASLLIIPILAINSIFLGALISGGFSLWLFISRKLNNNTPDL